MSNWVRKGNWLRKSLPPHRERVRQLREPSFPAPFDRISDPQICPTRHNKQHTRRPCPVCRTAKPCGSRKSGFTATPQSRCMMLCLILIAKNRESESFFPIECRDQHRQVDEGWRRHSATKYYHRPQASVAAIASSGSTPLVAVMQSAHKRDGHDPATIRLLHPPGFGRIFAQRQVSPSFVVIIQEPPDQPTQRFFVEDDQMVQTLAPQRTDHPLDVGSLLWRAGRSQQLLFSYLLREMCAEDAVPIPQQIA